MKNLCCFFVFILLLSGMRVGYTQDYRELSYDVYLDKVRGGWTGKAIGLMIGVPNEYSETWPPGDFEYFAEIPTHFSDRSSGDDLYLPLLHQLVLLEHGVSPTYEQILKAWDERLFTGKIWVSCQQALENYRAGIMPPLTGQPGYNSDWADMCANISTDNIGWSSPGMFNTAVRVSDYFSHITNWGYGADGGVYTAAMVSEAFFETDARVLVKKARSILPVESPLGKLIDDAILLSEITPDWRIARQALAKKYNPDLDPQDHKMLAATGIGVTLGLLYGNGDFTQSMLIAQKCGWDSDCTASTVAGIIGTMAGYSVIDPKWKLPVHDTYENYCLKGLPRWLSFTDISKSTVAVGEKFIVENGGKIMGSGTAKRYAIPVQKPVPLQRAEYDARIIQKKNQQEFDALLKANLKPVSSAWGNGWEVLRASFETKPEVLASYMGKTNVLKVQPGNMGAVLKKSITLQPGKFHYLKVSVAHHPRMLNEVTGVFEQGSWKLEVWAEDKKIGDFGVWNQGGLVTWEDPQFDLTAYAGKNVSISLIAKQDYKEFYLHQCASYWSNIELITLDKPEPWRMIQKSK